MDSSGTRMVRAELCRVQLFKDPIQCLNELGDFLLGDDIRRQKTEDVVAGHIDNVTRFKATIHNLPAREAQLHPENQTLSPNFLDEGVFIFQGEEFTLKVIALVHGFSRASLLPA